MKNLTSLLFCLFIFISGEAQNDISATEWQSDLRFLQQTVHEDYPFLFKKTTAEHFDQEVEKLHKSIPDLAPHEIVVGFARIVSLFQYGHTSVGLRSSPVPYKRIPVNLYHFNDGVYIQGIQQTHKRVLGAKVLKIEGHSIEDALAAIRPVVPAENDQFFKAYGLGYLLIPEVLHAQGLTDDLQDRISLTLEKDGKEFEYDFEALPNLRVPTRYSLVQNEGEWLDARTGGETPLYLKNLDQIYYYEYLPDSKTVYVRHSQIQDDPSEDIPAFYDRVFDFIEKNEVEKLVLDVRLNGGGNNYKNKPIVTGVIQSKINEPGKFVVIIGRRTFSACQNLVNELHNYTNAVFVGEPTAENINFYGDTRQVELPNSQMPVFLSFAWWQDKPQWENAPWLAPHLAVDMSFEEYKSNRDPVLEAALDFSADHVILDPMAHFTALFEKGQLDVLEADAQKMVNDPAYQFFDFEDKFNEAGYKLMGSGALKEALYVFQLNTKLFPESANAWDSFAEAHWKSDKIEEAKKYYNKAIALDPQGDIGNNARNMLKRIEKEN